MITATIKFVKTTKHFAEALFVITVLLEIRKNGTAEYQ